MPPRFHSGVMRAVCELSEALPFLLSPTTFAVRSFREQSRSYSSTETTTATLRPRFSMRTGSSRAVSIISPKLFSASRVEMDFIVETRPW